MLIRELYHKEPITITKDASITEALTLLIKKRFNGIVVVDNKNHPIGVLSIQDIAAATIPRQFKNNISMAIAMYKRGFFQEMCQAIAGYKVSQLMRKDFLTVTLETNIMAVTADFLKNDLYIVPVVEKGVLIGIVTRSEIKKALAENMGILPEKEKD